MAADMNLRTGGPAADVFLPSSDVVVWTAAGARPAAGVFVFFPESIFQGLISPRKMVFYMIDMIERDKGVSARMSWNTLKAFAGMPQRSLS